MFDYLQELLGERGLAPHGYCLLWDPALIWTHVLSDAFIGLSYFSIPIVLARLITARRDLQFGWVVWMFASFIMACGLTHFMSILVLWVPAYGVEALVKLATAVVSVITAVALWPLLPKVIALPSPAQLQRANAELRQSIVERDHALAALRRESEDRQRAEDMLRQSQKMEAVGQLTSGIAHDFNNLLTIVIANLERLSGLGVEDERATRAIDHAMQGAERAAKLTDQLLTFSRKQTLEALPHSLNAVVEDMGALLKRSVGERIVLRFDLDPQLPPVLIDLNQAQSAILNLALNARDAMPDGGTLTIRTVRRQDDASGYDEVVLEVADVGNGIAEEDLHRVFEPFYTTKPLGQGTGLGLSQVYGFVTQSEGEVDVRSRLGEGTVVSLRFPPSLEKDENIT